VSTEGDIRGFILAALGPKLEQVEMSPDAVGDDFNLFTSGLLDSMGFINLLGAVEKEFSVEVDFEELDPEEFSTIRGFIESIKKSMTR